MFRGNCRTKERRPSTSFTVGIKDEKFKIPTSAMQFKPQKYESIKLILKCIRKYFDATTLHGFKYLSEPNRPVYERVYWLSAIILVYCTVAFIITDQITIFMKNPVLITFDSKSRSVEEIPFPAVTICSDNQIRSSMINLTEASEYFHLLSSEMRKRFEYAVYICNLNHHEDHIENFEPKFFQDMLESIFGIDTCSEQIPKMEWGSVTIESPCRYFQPMVTIHGACLSFNMLPFANIFRNPTTIFRNWSEQYWNKKINVWSPDTGFANGAEGYPGPMPWRTVGSNMAYFGLNVRMEDYEELCSRGGKGFSVYLHNPAEMPSPSSHALVYLEENRDSTVSVSPKMYITDESLQNWSTRERGCYFQNERFLQYFQIYTQHNCELECKANFTLKICQCAPYHFPRRLNTPVCGPAKRQCMEDSIANSGDASSCHCLPSCSELQYEVRVNKAPRNLSQNLIHQSNETYTILKVMFQTNYFIGIKRTVMFGVSDFIANVGGILGLFWGFSILSLVEIIYFLLFRPCTNLTRQRRKIKPLKFNITDNVSSLDGSSKFHPTMSHYPKIAGRNIRS